MSDSNYIKIFTGNFLIAQRIVTALNEIGVIAVVKDLTDSGLISVFGSSNSALQEISIHKDELDKSVGIVESISSQLQ